MSRAAPPVTVVVLALALRIFFNIQVHTSPVLDLSRVKDLVYNGSSIPRQQYNDGTDMEAYDYIARWILANGWYEKSADVTPLYPYAFLPAVYGLTGAHIFATTIIQAVVDSVTVLLIYLLALRLYDRRVAVYAGLIAAVYAPFIVYQQQILGEFLLGLLVAAFFLVMLGYEGRMSPGRAAAAGVLFGLGILAKPTFVVFAPLAVLWMLKRSGRRPKDSLLPAAVVFALALAVVLPFSYRNWRATGGFHLVRGNSGKMLYMGNNPKATGAYGEPRGPEAARLAEETGNMPLGEKDRVYTRAAIGFIRDNPRAFLGLLWRKFTFFFGADEVPNNLSVRLFRQVTFLRKWIFPGFSSVLPIAVAGLLFSLKRRGVVFIAGQVAVYAAAIIAIVVVGRYRLAVLPLVIPAAGFALSEIILSFKNMRFGRAAAIAVVAAAVAVPVNWFDLRMLVRQKLNKTGFKRVTEYSVRYRDDSNHRTVFTAHMSGPTRIEKLLYVDRLPEDLREVVVACYLSVTRPGVLAIRLNEVDLRTPLLPGGEQWLKVIFPPYAVEAGYNTIALGCEGDLKAYVFADDVFDYGRSFYDPGTRVWLNDRFDFLTYRRQPSLHMGGHEFKIRLELIGGASATPE
ncbi:MAG: glycosyltransferase family 39 protein [Planctomycetota bacterium]|jgi:4-amino-4-deoxy-L-arabinose transferase-like glycosyltransferase